MYVVLRYSMYALKPWRNSERLSAGSPIVVLATHGGHGAYWPQWHKLVIDGRYRTWWEKMNMGDKPETGGSSPVHVVNQPHDCVDGHSNDGGCSHGL